MDQTIVKMSHIFKQYPGVLALNDVSFALKAGEVMALLGENGAGKSTLMKILSGVESRDSGEVEIFGQKVGDLTPKRAQDLGVAIIHQELNMCQHLSVAENIFLGRELQNGIHLDNKKMNEESREALARLNLDIDPNTTVGELSVSKQQLVEIAKALSTNARVLVMDEPTSALTESETEDLFKIIRKLKSEGHGIVYISHRLEELQQIVDCVTIMRDGNYITSGKFTDFTMDEIIANMVGREIKEKYPHINTPRGEKILEVKNLSSGTMVHDASFSLYEGEILGIAGLMGAGRTELTRAIFGVDAIDSGNVVLEGKTLKITKPMDAISAGVVLVPEDRKKDGLCTKLSIRENIALPNLDWMCNGIGVVERKKEEDAVKKAREDLHIRMSDPEANADSLSGGNQQKIVVGKWLARSSRVVIFDEPTRGIDVAAKVEIYNLMNQLKAEGIGVLFVSSEMPEILGMSDRILVMCDGRITGELDPKETTQAEVLSYATRFESKV